MTAATAEHLAPAIDLDQRRAQDARDELDYFADKFAAEEEFLTAEYLDSSVEAILDRVARRPDGSLDLERLARLTVTAALRIERLISDSEVFAQPCPCCCE